MDKHDRDLNYISPCEEEEIGLINLRMIEQGVACLYIYRGKHLQLEPALRAAQRQAQMKHRGGWENNPNFCRN